MTDTGEEINNLQLLKVIKGKNSASLVDEEKQEEITQGNTEEKVEEIDEPKNSRPVLFDRWL